VAAPLPPHEPVPRHELVGETISSQTRSTGAAPTVVGQVMIGTVAVCLAERLVAKWSPPTLHRKV
jgi:hypothetical protein